MSFSQVNFWNSVLTSTLLCWLSISLWFGYRDYLSFISKAKDAGQEQINIYFATEVTCLAQFLILLAVYSINSYDLNYHILTSAGRTLLQIVPAIFWLGMVSAFSKD